MNLVSFPKTRAGTAAQLALASLVLAVGCGDGSDKTTSGDDSTTAVEATDTSASSTPTTGDPGEESTAGQESTAGEDTTGDVPAVSYTVDIQPIWDMRCVTGCHVEGGSGFLSADLLLTPEKSYAQLVGVMSVGSPGLSRVAATDPEGSYLWHKLNNTQVDVNGGGSQMPVGGLPADQIAKIEQWIDEGAKP
jgi:hypothetical protein